MFAYFSIQKHQYIKIIFIITFGINISVLFSATLQTNLFFLAFFSEKAFYAFSTFGIGNSVEIEIL